MTNLFMTAVNRNAHSITLAERANKIRIGDFAFEPDHNSLASGKAAGTINDACCCDYGMAALAMASAASSPHKAEQFASNASPPSHRPRRNQQI